MCIVYAVVRLVCVCGVPSVSPIIDVCGSEKRSRWMDSVCPGFVYRLYIRHPSQSERAAAFRRLNQYRSRYISSCRTTAPPPPGARVGGGDGKDSN